MTNNQNIVKVLAEIKETGTINLNSIKELPIEEQELIINLYNDGLIDEALNFVKTINVENSWEAFKNKLALKRKKPTVALWKKAYKYAAILVLCLSLGFYLKNVFFINDNTEVASDTIELILENGEKKIININDEIKIVEEKGEVVGVQKGDLIDYKSNSKTKKLVFNTLKVPYGKTFNISLSDGTKVFLNSGTTLKYPVSFIDGNNREVFLEGEAFFEVTKDANHPFIVNANKMNIEVLGTKFNVSSYNDDDNINAVLVEGSVSLSSEDAPNENILLKPGYKGSLNKITSGNIALEKVDTRIYTEWMNGDVIFRNSSFSDMTKKLERNYNVTIQNNYQLLNSKKFNASFNKKIESIEDIINAISEIYPFTYQKQDNIIIINQ